MDEELRQYLAAMEARMNERMEKTVEKTETKLLTAFHRWSRAMEIRVRNNTSAVYGFDERLAIAEERISELERGSNG